MAISTIPVRSDLESYSLTIALDGTTYGFDFHWNARMGKWIFDLYDSTLSPILEDLPVYVGQFPLVRFQDARLPPGILYFFDTTGQDLDPGQDDFGTRVLMIYADESEGI
jgi:hypothetical protein